MAVPDVRTMDLDNRPVSWRTWWSDLARHREVLVMLAKADFHVRYKRATLGVLWAVVVPLVQAAVLALVFSRVIRVGTGSDFAAYILSGVLPWSYFAQTLSIGSVAVAEGRNLTDKVWFPRIMLPMVPALANTAGLAVSMIVLLVAAPFLGGDVSFRLLFIVPALALLFAFTLSLSAVLAAMHVYFRDVRFLVAASMLVWFYVTPVAYPQSLLGGLRTVVAFNPMTGIIDLFRLAIVGGQPNQVLAIAVSVVVTVLLMVLAIETYRRHDRLFVDRL